MDQRERIVFAGICTAAALGMILLVTHPDPHTHTPDLSTVVEIWGDVLRDVDRFGLTVTQVSDTKEMEIGREIDRQISASSNAYVTEIGKHLVQHVRRKNIHYTFAVIDEPDINAFSLPGGYVYITWKMLAFLQSEAELAAILGHEISHVDMKHCIENLQYEMVVRKIGIGDLAKIATVAHTLITVGYSEQQELEADAGGMLLAAEAGYDPAAAVAVFTRLNKLYGDSQQAKGSMLAKALQQYFSTHPPTTERIVELQKVMKRNNRAWKGKNFHIGREEYMNNLHQTGVGVPQDKSTNNINAGKQEMP